MLKYLGYILTKLMTFIKNYPKTGHIGYQ